MEQNKEKRLESFEAMLLAIETECSDIMNRMDRLKNEGKVKSVTYQQLFARKLMYTNMLAMYELYNLRDK